jgi:hypothetical protein
MWFAARLYFAVLVTPQTPVLPAEVLILLKCS